MGRFGRSEAGLGGTREGLRELLEALGPFLGDVRKVLAALGPLFWAALGSRWASLVSSWGLSWPTCLHLPLTFPSI